MSLRAMYAGVCARCGDPFEQGEPIAKTPRGYIHVGCASGADE